MDESTKIDFDTESAPSERESQSGYVAAGADRVLLVEDSALDARLVESFLRRADPGPYDVVRVRTMSEARGALHRDAYAAILLDLNLPDARGLEALEGIRHASGGVPVVVLTGSDDKLGLAAVRAGAEDFLLKGRLSPPLLGRVVRYAIERAEFRRRTNHAGRLIAAGRLAATVAHELNNPAAFIVANQHTQRELLGAVRDALASARPDLVTRIDEALELLEDNRVGMERIQSIVKSLKGFTQPSRGAIARVDLPEVVREACRLVENEIRYVARLELDLEKVPPIAGDRTRLVQLVTNLVSNAAHAIEARDGDDFVRVSVRPAADEVALLVEDTGRGIPDHLRERIFEPFFTTREHAGGTGLGLALTAEIVRQHRGVIRHWDRVPRGTVMEVRLPQATGLVPEAEAAGGRPDAALDRRGRVLLIDDETHLLRAIKRALQPHEVVTAAGGREALELLANDVAFDAIFCDLMMPEVDGAAVHGWIEEHAPALLPKLVFVSGGAFTGKVQRFLSRVGLPVVDKPVDVPTLRKVLARVLASAPAVG